MAQKIILLWNGTEAWETGNQRQSFGRWTHRHGRRKLTGNRKLYTKEDKCKLLIICANALSYYDFFVYFYSDDIDPMSGEVDGNIIKFDERDIGAKYKSIQALAASLAPSC